MSDVSDPFAEFQQLQRRSAPRIPSGQSQDADRPQAASPTTTGADSDAPVPQINAARPPAPAIPTATARAEEEEEEGRVSERRGAGRDILLGVYIDAEMDGFVDRYADRRIEGLRKRPSRSLVGYWLMALGMEALKSQGEPAMPRAIAKRRSPGDRVG